MRLFLLVLLTLLVATVYSQVVDVNVLYKQSVPESAISAISRIVKRISNDNRFITANLASTHCTDAAGDVCSDISNGFKVVIKDHSKPALYQSVVISNEEITNMENIVLRLVADFATSVYTSRANEEDANDWWSMVDENLRTAISSKSLTKQSEISTLTSGDTAKHAFVLYYKPEFFANFAALFYTVRAAQTTKATFGLVDCSSTAEMCTEHESLPVLESVWRQEKYSKFEGSWTEEAIRDWMLNLRHPAITQLTEDIVPMYRAGIVPGFETKQDTVTMLFVPSKSEPIYKEFKRFAKANHGKYHLTAMVNKNVRKWAHQPAFITMKPLEKIQQAFVMYKDLSYDGMVEFIVNGIYPSIHDMTSAASAAEALSLPRPLLIFFDPEGTRNSSEFETLAAEHPVRSTVAAFATIKGVNLFGLFLNDMLSSGKSLRPSYLLVDAQKGCIYRELIANDSQQQIMHWLQSSLKLDCHEEFDLDHELLLRISDSDRRAALRKALNSSQQATKKHEEL